MGSTFPPRLGSAQSRHLRERVQLEALGRRGRHPRPRWSGGRGGDGNGSPQAVRCVPSAVGSTLRGRQLALLAHPQACLSLQLCGAESLASWWGEGNRTEPGGPPPARASIGSSALSSASLSRIRCPRSRPYSSASTVRLKVRACAAQGSGWTFKLI